MKLSLILHLVNYTLNKENLSEAIRCYEKVLETEDEIAGVNVNQRMADSISAEEHLKKHFPIMKRHFQRNWRLNTLFNYAFTALQAGFNNKAIEKFLELKELDPEYYSLYIHLARAYEREEEPEKGY